MTLVDLIHSNSWFENRESEYLRWYPKALIPIDGSEPEDLANKFLDQAGHLPSVEGVYIHIPFCDRLCRFCPFNKRQRDEALLTRYVDALLSEIQLYGLSLQRSAQLDYIYFGGGTPSVLAPEEIDKILSALDRHVGRINETEITLETHPTHATVEYMDAVRSVGVNRMSIGVQAYSDSELIKMGAQHTADDVERALASAETVGFPVGIDLLYRRVGHTKELWIEELKKTANRNIIEHVSCYSLVLKNDRDQPDTFEDVTLACTALEVLESAGFEHYAACASGGLDFGKPGRHCSYEVDHWRAPQTSFLGLGAGAFGYLSQGNTVNGLGIPQYIESALNGRLPLASVRFLTKPERMRRYFILGVKTLEVDLEPFAAEFGRDAREVFSREFETLLDLGLAECNEKRLLLSATGRLFTDQIAELFYTEEDRLEDHPEEPEVRRAELQGRAKAKSTTAQP